MIREATQQDYDCMATVMGNAFYEDIHEDDSIEIRRTIALYGSKHPFIVYEENGVIVGTVGVDANNERIRLLAVNPDFHGKGIGKKLLSEAEKRVRLAGKDRAYVHPIKEVQGYYFPQGYESIDERTTMLVKKF